MYTIRAVADADPTVRADDMIIGKYFAGGDPDGNGTFDTGSISTTTNPGADNEAGYFATTYSSQVGYICDIDTPDTDELYNVGNATVKNVDDGNRYPGINDTLTALNNASSLVNNVGVPVSCVLNTSDIYGRTVSVIYVNAVVTP